MSHHRRSNKSAKVPNVKLRPAAPTARSKRQKTPPPAWIHDSGFDSEPEPSAKDLCPRPFKGVSVCATGINDKMTLFKQALELGASSFTDLTDKVTHLIALEPGSAKYKCALENRIPIMHPSWITDSHEAWLRGDDVDLQQSVETHRLPIFAGVVLSLSGLEDIPQRTEINRLVTQNGGKYVKNLERPVRVTHLLCASCNEEKTEKMRYAEKFNQRGEANVHIIWEEWFWDSLHFGGRFDEEPYKVSNPPPQRKALPETATPPPASSSPADEHVLQASSGRIGGNDLLSVAMHEEEEIASVRRVPSEMLQIWSSLLRPRGFEVMNGRLVRSPSKSQAADNGNCGQPKKIIRETSPSRSKAERLTVRKPNSSGNQAPTSALSTFRRTHSFAPVAKDASTSRLPFKRAPTAGPSSSFLAHPSAGSRVDELSGLAGPIASSSTSGLENGQQKAPELTSTVPTIFTGLKFRALGEARGPSVKAAIEECGGLLISEEADDVVDYVIVRLVSGSSFYLEESEVEERAKYRTECWLERCIFDERICAPDEHVAFTPLDTQIPVAGAEMINLSYSGLDQSEACWVRRLIRALGANIAPNFSRRSTHLLCPSGLGTKAEKAREWGIPVVDISWLASIAKTGIVPPIVSSGESSAQGVTTMQGTESAMYGGHLKIDHKGKGKEKASDFMMADITNGVHNGSPAVVDSAVSDSPAATSGSGPPMAVDTVDELLFGQPNELLGGILIRQGSATTPAPLARPATLEQSSTGDSPSAFGRILVADSRGPSFSATDRSKTNERVPSSESPSPMKLLDTRSPGSMPPPAKITTEATKVLQDSITSLLGKRPSAEDETNKVSSSRLGKRARPPSRTKSSTSHDSSKPIDPEVLPVLNTSGGFDPDALGDDELDMLHDKSADGESVRVTYEDPGQREEKKKLMKLLASQKRDEWELDNEPDPKGKRTKSSRRRSARVAVS